jgi:hypothetical protein
MGRVRLQRHRHRSNTRGRFNDRLLLFLALRFDLLGWGGKGGGLLLFDLVGWGRKGGGLLLFDCGRFNDRLLVFLALACQNRHCRLCRLFVHEVKAIVAIGWWRSSVDRSRDNQSAGAHLCHLSFFPLESLGLRRRVPTRSTLEPVGPSPSTWFVLPRFPHGRKPTTRCACNNVPACVPT